MGRKFASTNDYGPGFRRTSRPQDEGGTSSGHFGKKRPFASRGLTRLPEVLPRSDRPAGCFTVVFLPAGDGLAGFFIPITPTLGGTLLRVDEVLASVGALTPFRVGRLAGWTGRGIACCSFGWRSTLLLPRFVLASVGAGRDLARTPTRGVDESRRPELVTRDSVAAPAFFADDLATDPFRVLFLCGACESPVRRSSRGDVSNPRRQRSAAAPVINFRRPTL